MAKTVVYVQEHGYDTHEDLEQAHKSVSGKLSNARKTLRSTEDHIKVLNEQIRFVGMYYANKTVKANFLKAQSKAQFRQKNLRELESYEAGVKYIKEHFGGKAPSLKNLKVERDQFLQIKDAQVKTYQYFKEYQKELQTVCANVDSILGRECSRTVVKEKAPNIS